MRKGDKQYGKPYEDYTDTKVNIEALSGVSIGAHATTTDTLLTGYYNGSAWVWQALFVDKTAFTPVVAGGTSAGTGTYSTQLGQYSRIGNIVFFVLHLIWSAHSGTGVLTITGLPITSANNGIHTPVIVFWSGLTLLAPGNKVLGRITANTQIIYFDEIADGALLQLPMDTAGSLNIEGFYFVD